MANTSLSDPRVQALLDAREVAVLATLRPDGAPVAMAIWFVHDEARITMISVDGLAKVRNLRRDPRACVAVESVEAGAMRCASVQGRVEFVDAPECRRPLVERLLARYGPAIERRWGGRGMPADRVMFQLVPERVSYWG